MQFQIPQDVQREDTIIGPLTLRQMIILGIGGGLAYSIYVTLATNFFIEVWLPPVAIVSCITLAFAFLKIHDLPFHLFLLNLIEYHVLPKKRIWIQKTGKPSLSELDELTQKKEQTQNISAQQQKKQEISKLNKYLSSQNQAELNQWEKHQELSKLINQNHPK